MTRRRIFISHSHSDDELLPKLKDLIQRAGMEVSDSSINSSNPNNATAEAYIKSGILAPAIQQASTIVVLISHNTATSDWVNWEIDYALQNGKRLVGVYAHGATDADVPESLARCGDAAVVGWNGERVVAAINGEAAWDDPATGLPRDRAWLLQRYTCR